MDISTEIVEKFLTISKRHFKLATPTKKERQHGKVSCLTRSVLKGFKYTTSFRINPISFASLATIGMLAGCGENNALGSQRSVAMGSTARPASLTRVVPTGRLHDSDAKLFVAAVAGDAVLLKRSIEAGGNIKATDRFQRTPLFAAAFCNHPHIVNLLIEKGGDVNAKDFEGCSPLHAAIVGGGKAAAEALIARGADVNFAPDAGVSTPLELASAANQDEIVNLLLESGANPDVQRDVKENTADAAGIPKTV